MVQKLSPSAFHHGSVHGCLSARADLLIRKILLKYKVLHISMGLSGTRGKNCILGLPFMHIDQQKCVACGNCVAICPMGAISIDSTKNRAHVNADECVECYTCFRGMSMEHLNPTMVRGIRRLLKVFRLRFDPEPDVCPTSAIIPDELSWPRVVRRAFSDPIVTHESTGVHGRGTEEVKTNDVTNRVGIGEAGYVIEFGRPTVGVRFRGIEKMTE